ncbi:hypothetical protein H2203_002181 [Taxawa tesnikishii (nom. ined.)]|nr:hypothetical protein H2203_002181 [Dothideales sp. JES 119]
MHVSQRYLDLTQQKLQLARLPREPPAFTQGYGVRRAELEPLLDFWLESYDCRAQEEMYNNRLPQYRTNITYIQKPHHEATSLRVHFVHRKSTFANAVPLLVCHDWGSSFIEVSKMIDTLCEPISTPPLGNVDVQAFHVVCPSIPGFGFSDASPNEAFGLQGTAEVFRLLMERLGYERFLLHGSGWYVLVGNALEAPNR